MTTMPGQTMRNALEEQEQRLPARADANTFRVQQQFMQAHGAPRGQLTMLVTTSLDGGVFLCTKRP